LSSALRGQLYTHQIAHLILDIIFHS
jgi:hypothetical protein